MNTTEDLEATEAAPFGAFAPRGGIAALIWLTQHSTIGRGWVRRKFWGFMERRPQRCYDMVVRGVKMRLFPFDSTVERKLIFRPDRYCPEEIAYLRQVLTGGSTYMDIGANVGALTLPVAALPGVRVIAVEPGPLAVSRLRLNLRLNGFSHVVVAEVAVSDKEGEVVFTSDERDIKYSGINGRWAQGKALRLPAKRLATILAENCWERFDAMKIDVEGHEDAILLPFYRDNPRALWPRHVIIEAIPREGLPGCIEHMHGLGYRDVFKTRSNLCLTLTS